MPIGELEFPDIAAVYERFTALASISSELGGCFLLYSGLAREGIAIAMASNIAGAASLGIQADTARAKHALRSGVCDFVVNDLDEALRILKNEIRKWSAVSVVLTGENDILVEEIVARGVQPDILTFPVRELIERGARVLSADTSDSGMPISWSIDREPARWLPSVDALATASLDDRSDKDPRSRWIENSPRYLGRAFAGQRFLRMSDAEAGAFVAALRHAIETGTILAKVNVTRGGKEILLAS